MINTTTALEKVFEAEMSAASELIAAKEVRAAFARLEHAHVFGQIQLRLHVRVHLSMLRAGWLLRDGTEVAGQLLRLALIPVGHLFGRLPIGNTGGANVSAFKRMPINEEVQRLLHQSR